MCHLDSKIFLFASSGFFLNAAFVSLDFRRKDPDKSTSLYEEDKAAAGSGGVGVRGLCYHAGRDFISFCLLNKFVFSAGPSTNGIIQMNLAPIAELEVRFQV